MHLSQTIVHEVINKVTLPCILSISSSQLWIRTGSYN